MSKGRIDFDVLSETETGKHHVLKTQMHELWDKVLRKYIYSIGTGDVNEESDKLIKAMENDISGPYSNWGSCHQKWHLAICQDKNILSWLDNKRKVEQKKERLSIILENNRIRMDVGTNSNGPRIIRDEKMDEIQKEIENNSAISSSSIECKEFTNGRMYYFPSTEFKVDFKDVNNNIIVDNNGLYVGFIIRPSTGEFESLRKGKWKLKDATNYISKII